MAWSDIGSAMGIGKPGFGEALQTASPLLMAMAAGLQSGHGAMSGLPYGLEAMSALSARRKEEEQQKAVQQALSGAMGSPVPSAPTMATKDAGLPSMMGAAPPQAPGAIPGFMLDPSKLPAIFQQTEQKYQLPAGYLGRTAQIESGGNPSARNPNSSAAGLFQFTKGTAADYGVNPMDPVSSTDGAARLAADNAAALTNALGRQPTAGELYLAHQQGPGGAIKLLTNPNAKASDIVGADAVRLNGGNANMTAQDFANQWVSRFGGQPAPASDPTIQRLTAILGMPGISPQQAEAVKTMISTRVASMPQGISPDVAAQLGYKQWEASQPQPGADPVAALHARAADAGLAPGTPEFQQFMLSGGDGQQQETFRPTTPEENKLYGIQSGQIGPGGKLVPIRNIADQTASAEAEQKLRQEFSRIQVVQDYQQQASAMGRLQSSLSDPTGAGDLSAIFAYMKILDPNSVVKEGEFATAANSGGVGASIINLYNRIKDGERLTDAQRNDFLNRGQKLFDQSQKQYQKLADQYSTVAKRQNLDPSNVIPSYGYDKPPDAPKKKQPLVIDNYTIEQAD